MGASCTKIQSEEDVKDAAIKRLLESDAKKEKGVLKLLLLGAGESGKSTVFKQIKFLFQRKYNETERCSYTRVIHANVFQSVRTLLNGCKEFSERGGDASSKYILLPENQEYAERLSEIETPNDFPPLDEQNALKIQSCWNDPAVQEAFLRGNELPLPDCTKFFLDNVLRLAEKEYVPLQEDILYAREQTTGIVETLFSPNKEKQGSSYRLYDVGGQRSERRKWIHLFDGVTAIIFCAALSEYDQMLLEDNKKNRAIETRDLLVWLLQEPWFQDTTFLVFLNKFDLFQEKALKVPLSVCEWFQDYQPSTTNFFEVEHAYNYVEQKFHKLYEENTPRENINRVFKVYKTTAIDENIIKSTFDAIDRALANKRLTEADLW